MLNRIVKKIKDHIRTPQAPPEDRIENKAKLPQQLIDLLVADFQPLTPGSMILNRRILNYLLNSKDEGVLETLAAMTDSAATLGLCCSLQWNSHAFKKYEEGQSRRFWLEAPFDNIAFTLRLAKIYGALAQNSRTWLRCEDGLGDARWLEPFIIEALHIYPLYRKPKPELTSLTAQHVEKMLKADGQTASLLVSMGMYLPEQFSTIKGFKECAERHMEAVREAVMQKSAETRIAALRVIREHGIAIEPLADALVNAALSPAKTVREAAMPLIEQAPSLAAPLLRNIACQGTAEERMRAIVLLAQLEKEACHAFLIELKEREKSSRVLQEIDNVLSLQNETFGSRPQAQGFVLPLISKIDTLAPLTREAMDGISRLCEAYDSHNGTPAPGAAGTNAPPLNGIKSAIREDAQFICERLQDLMLPDITKRWDKRIPCFPKPDLGSILDDVAEFVRGTPLDLIHVLRLFFLVGAASYPDLDPFGRSYWLESVLRIHRAVAAEPYSLRHVARAFEAMGGDPKYLGQKCLGKFKPIDWEMDAVWPYFVEYPEAIEAALGLRPRYWNQDEWLIGSERLDALEILVAFPSPPPALTDALLNIAIGGSDKRERSLAQKTLAPWPPLDSRLLAALKSTNIETRARAAEWISRCDAPAMKEALHAAFERERSDIAQDAMLRAMELLGMPLKDRLNREKLLNESLKGVAKGLPGGLAWVPWETIPSLRWLDDDAPVPGEIPRWMIAKCFTRKNPEPDPLLRGYCEMLRKEDRESLAKWLIHLWIAEDTQLAYTEDEVQREADIYARTYSGRFGMTYEELFGNHARYLRNVLKGSAIASKGILAVVAACGGADLAPIVMQYLREWYGMRAAQCRALIRMLVWVPEPSAIQIVLSVATRFRTRGIQKEAEDCVKSLAERNGWTVDELADRTIPMAGMDEDGVLRIDYGERGFNAHLGSDLKFEIADDTGKILSSLPDQRSNEDETQVNAAKKAFAQAKKELSSTLKFQAIRLYEAMCAGRSWKYDDWRRYLASHPIMRHLCRRVVWALSSNDKVEASFRLLEDGSLTDAKDEEVNPKPAHHVRVAHATILPTGADAEWRQHFVDYEVNPLFNQFREICTEWSAENRNTTSLTGFRGWMTDALRLRGQTTARGYIRGKTEDAGWFYTYEKYFPSLSIKAVIEFTGTGLPEQNIPVALKELHFEHWEERQKSSQNNDGHPVALSRVPPILLSECWNDLREIAAAGDGYSPDWRKKYL